MSMAGLGQGLSAAGSSLMDFSQQKRREEAEQARLAKQDEWQQRRFDMQKLREENLKQWRAEQRAFNVAKLTEDVASNEATQQYRDDQLDLEKRKLGVAREKVANSFGMVVQEDGTYGPMSEEQLDSLGKFTDATSRQQITADVQKANELGEIFLQQKKEGAKQFENMSEADVRALAWQVVVSTGRSSSTSRPKFSDPEKARIKMIEDEVAAKQEQISSGVLKETEIAQLNADIQSLQQERLQLINSYDPEYEEPKANPATRSPLGASPVLDSLMSLPDVK